MSIEEQNKEKEARELATKFVRCTSSDFITCNEKETSQHFKNLISKHGLPPILQAMKTLDDALYKIEAMYTICPPPQRVITPVDMLTSIIITGGENAKKAVELLTMP